MAESQQESVEDTNTGKCQICLKTFKELKILKCKHSFCICCLHNWLKEKGELECPSCRQIHSVPDGGLQELPSNTIEAETSENLIRDHNNIKCCCGKCNADFYCEDCNQYLCTSCKTTHELFPALKNHTLQPINAMLLSTEAMHQPMCPQHEKELEYYCKVCKTPICQKCANIEHTEDDGQHETIRASHAFSGLRISSNALMIQVEVHKQQAQEVISKCMDNASELSKRRNDIIKDINTTVEEMVKLVSETGKALEDKLKDVCEAKDEKNNSQIDELKSTISDVEEKQDCITKLLKSGKVTTLHTCQQAIQELQQKIAVLPERQPRDDGKIFFSSRTDQIVSSFKENGIGTVSEKPNANIFEIVSANPVRCYGSFYVEIAQRHKCEIDINDLSAVHLLKKPIEMDYTYKAEIVKSQGKYFLKGSSMKDLTLDVKLCDSPIKGSPIQIQIIKHSRYSYSAATVYLAKDIMGCSSIKDLVMSENGWFLVVCNSNYVLKFEKSGALLSTITLPEVSKVNQICKLRNNNLMFYDYGKQNIQICKQDGQVIKSINLESPKRNCLSLGIDMNENLNLVYVANQTANCVQVYSLESLLKVSSIGSKGGLEGQMNRPSDVAVTKEGNLIVSERDNHRLQLFDIDGQFIKILIGGGDKDGMVIRPTRVSVDDEDNIIVASESKVQLFDNHGNFIKVIHQIINEKKQFAISIVSHFPRKIALAEIDSLTISVHQY
ncbi:E3 ubiquitin-protein ligase TRIM71-like [Anneissia japonica]|uniref:E3 ubiquitin-protein ligase TRIM71-like n=1 Tax=Anneissia japonica TaxID=1529436 RepID=UPI00142572E7|nr:E3 ubiquitin-protein ligase TRIM71-like [Anneissia japonica]